MQTEEMHKEENEQEKVQGSIVDSDDNNKKQNELVERTNSVKRADDETKEFEEYISKLVNERNESCLSDFMSGEEDAARDIYSLSYYEIMEVVNSDKHFSDMEIWEMKEIDTNEMAEDDPSFDLESYMRGWIDGIKVNYSIDIEPNLEDCPIPLPA